MDLPKLLAEAENGSTVARTILGISYYYGNGVEQNYNEALRWLGLAAEKGASRALYHLGLIYEQGLVGNVNLEQAFQCFHRAAKREEVLAYIHVARMLRHGLGTSSDENAARSWYMRVMEESSKGWSFDYTEEAREFVNKMKSD